MQIHKEKILVTGATGNIGWPLVKRLLGMGLDVRGACHSENGCKKLDSAGCKDIVRMDYHDMQSVARALDGVDRVFLLIPLIPGMREIGLKMVDACIKAKVKYVVRISGLGASPDARLRLGRWHGDIDVALMESGISHTILRPAPFMQNILSQNRQEIEGYQAVYMPTGDGKIAWIDVRDIADVAVNVLTGEIVPHAVHVLTGDEALSYAEICVLLCGVLERQITFHDIPVEQARKALLEAGLDEEIVSALCELFDLYRVGGAGVVTTECRRLLGHSCRTMAQFLNDCRFMISHEIPRDDVFSLCGTACRA